MRLGSSEVVWQQGPFEARPTITMEIAIQIPDEAYRSDFQEVALADLLVHVTAYLDGTLIENFPAPAARVAWPDGPDRPPLILDHRTATEEAPAGMLGVSVAAEPDGEPTGGVPADLVSP